MAERNFLRHYNFHQVISSQPDLRLSGNIPRVSSVHPAHLSAPELRTSSTSSVHPNQSLLQSLDPEALHASIINVRSSTSPVAEAANYGQLTAPTLTAAAPALCAWRLQSFYSEYLTPEAKQNKGLVTDPDVLETLEAIDWLATKNDLTAACRTKDKWTERGLGWMSKLILKNEHVYKTVTQTAKNTDIPFEQLRMAIEHYALYRERSAPLTKATRFKCATPLKLAQHHAWDKLAATVYADIQDLEKGRVWIPEINSSTDVLGAVRRCRDEYFSRLGFVKEKGVFKNLKRGKRGKVDWAPTREVREGREGGRELDEAIARERSRERMRRFEKAARRVGERTRSKEEERQRRHSGQKKENEVVGEAAVLERSKLERKSWEEDRRRIEKGELKMAPLAKQRFPIDGSKECVKHPDGNCDCPGSPHLLEMAARSSHESRSVQEAPLVRERFPTDGYDHPSGRVGYVGRTRERHRREAMSIIV